MAARESLAALAEYLKLRHFEADVAEADATLRATNTGTRAVLDIVCRPRADDGGRLWLLTSDGKPLDEADRIVNAAIAVMALLPPEDREAGR